MHVDKSDTEGCPTHEEHAACLQREARRGDLRWAHMTRRELGKLRQAYRFYESESGGAPILWIWNSKAEMPQLKTNCDVVWRETPSKIRVKTLPTDKGWDQEGSSRWLYEYWSMALSVY